MKRDRTRLVRFWELISKEELRVFASLEQHVFTSGVQISLDSLSYALRKSVITINVLWICISIHVFPIWKYKVMLDKKFARMI